MTNDFTRDPGTPVNLDAPITLEEYERVLWRVVEAGRILAHTSGWCSQWLNTLQNLSEDFTNYPYDEDRYDDNGGWIDPDTVEEHGGVNVHPITGVQPRDMFTEEGWAAYNAEHVGGVYARRLRDIRGRLLAIVHGDGDSDGDVDLDTMNDVFIYIGFPVYTPVPETQVVEVNIHRTLYFRVPGDVTEEDVRERVENGLLAFAEHMDDTIRDEDGDECTLSHVYEVDVNEDEDATGVREDDTVELLRRA